MSSGRSSRASPKPVPAAQRGLAAGRWLTLAALVSGCGGWPWRTAPEEPGIPPTPVQQVGVYPEAVTGRFVSLADFEDSPLQRQRGHVQAQHFALEPASAEGEVKFVVSVTRTGAGALEAVLAPGAGLVYRMSEVHDFSAYTLLSAAVYSRAIRDDLKVRLSTDRAGWESLPVLLRPGWNNVLIDLQRIQAMPDFDARAVRSMRLWFAQATEPVRINLDDVMLIDNRREIAPAPPEVHLHKKGLDYELSLPGRRPIRIAQQDDGLWRLGPDQMAVELLPAPAARTQPPSSASTVRALPPQEDISLLGRRRVGEMEVLEHNAIRLRLANTWYFPAESGLWASMSVRQVRWEHTFYADGRWITDLTVNNAGGEEISSVRLAARAAGVWSDGRGDAQRPVEPFPGTAGRWNFLAATGQVRDVQLANHLKPARLEVALGAREVADGDANGDGFDESQGCYRLQARAGHCRFMLAPGGEGLADAVVRVSGKWTGPVSANCEGRAIRNLVRLDGGVLFVLPGMIQRPTWVEVTGPAPLVGGD